MSTTLHANTEATPAEVFRHIYQTGLWGPTWSSGSGSNPNQEGKYYCTVIPPLLRLLEARSVVDIGCGDGRILASIATDTPKVTFCGVDCVSEQIDKLRVELPHHHWQLNNLQLLSELNALPHADVYLCKDVFHHWPTAWIINFLNFLQAKRPTRTMIACQDVQQAFNGQDCDLGAYRALSGTMKPWSIFCPQLLATYLHKAIWLLRF